MSMVMGGIAHQARSLPHELRDFNQWVTWRYELRNGKRTKVPIDAKTFRYASCDDPTTWSSFEVAFRACAERTDFDGVAVLLALSPSSFPRPDWRGSGYIPRFSSRTSTCLKGHSHRECGTVCRG